METRIKKPEIDYTRRRGSNPQKPRNHSNMPVASEQPFGGQSLQTLDKTPIKSQGKPATIQEEDDVDSEHETMRKFNEHSTRTIAMSWRRASKIGLENERELGGIFKQIYARKVSLQHAPSLNDISLASPRMTNVAHEIMRRNTRHS
jgi:hypothetical protein